MPRDISDEQSRLARDYTLTITSYMVHGPTHDAFGPFASCHEATAVSFAPVTVGDVTALFQRHFGHPPTVIASAPGRVNLIGEHTDYNGGEVLPIGIAHRTWIAVAPTTGTRSTAVSSGFESLGEWNAAKPERSGDWWDYLSGITSAFQERGLRVPSLQIGVASDVPAGAGLSSSAAIEVAMAFALTSLLSTDLSPRDAALLSHVVENQFVGVNSGIMDQFASALAEAEHALHLDCETARYEQVPMREAVLIFDTAVPRSLRGSDFNKRRAECEEALEILRRTRPELRSLAAASPDEIRAARLPGPLDRRALHVSQETRRVQRTVDALRTTGTIPGELLYESHESLRVLYECSTPELDWFVQRASSAPGVRGARLTGAGWGGCAIAVGHADALTDFASSIIDDYTSRFGLTPRAWVTRAAAGARVDLHSA